MDCCTGVANDSCTGADDGITDSFLFLRNITKPIMMIKGMITKTDKMIGLKLDESSIIASPSLETSNSIREFSKSSTPDIEIASVPLPG